MHLPLGLPFSLLPFLNNNTKRKERKNSRKKSQKSFLNENVGMV